MRNVTVGIYVSGHDFRKVDTIEIEGAPDRVVQMRRTQLEGEAVTLILKASE